MYSLDSSKNASMHLNLYAAPSIKDFLARFNKELESLIEILQREQNVLIKGSADEISSIAHDKLTYMQVLSDFIANHFNDSSVNINNNLEKSLNMLNTICIEENIEEWNVSQNLIRFSRELSDENSILLANRLKSTNSALDTLYSLSGSQQTNTYDDRGHSTHPLISRQITSV